MNAACDADWLGFSLSHAAPWGEGRKLCHSARGDIVDTRSSEIRVDFNSDDSVEDRGFWLHYSGEETIHNNTINIMTAVQ